MSTDSIHQLIRRVSEAGFRFGEERGLDASNDVIAHCETGLGGVFNKFFYESQNILKSLKKVMVCFCKISGKLSQHSACQSLAPNVAKTLMHQRCSPIDVFDLSIDEKVSVVSDMVAVCWVTKNLNICGKVSQQMDLVKNLSKYLRQQLLLQHYVITAMPPKIFNKIVHAFHTVPPPLDLDLTRWAQMADFKGERLSVVRQPGPDVDWKPFLKHIELKKSHEIKDKAITITAFTATFFAGILFCAWHAQDNVDCGIHYIKNHHITWACFDKDHKQIKGVVFDIKSRLSKSVTDLTWIIEGDEDNFALRDPSPGVGPLKNLGRLALFYKERNSFYRVESYDGGASWKRPELVPVTNQASQDFPLIIPTQVVHIGDYQLHFAPSDDGQNPVPGWRGSPLISHPDEHRTIPVAWIESERVWRAFSLPTNDFGLLPRYISKDRGSSWTACPYNTVTRYGSIICKSKPEHPSVSPLMPDAPLNVVQLFDQGRMRTVIAHFNSLWARNVIAISEVFNDEKGVQSQCQVSYYIGGGVEMITHQVLISDAQNAMHLIHFNDEGCLNQSSWAFSSPSEEVFIESEV